MIDLGSTFLGVSLRTWITGGAIVVLLIYGLIVGRGERVRD